MVRIVIYFVHGWNKQNSKEFMRVNFPEASDIEERNVSLSFNSNYRFKSSIYKAEENAFYTDLQKSVCKQNFATLDNYSFKVGIGKKMFTVNNGKMIC